jgi:hypothetical protein
MRITQRLPSLSNVAAGLTAVLNCPRGLTYDKIVLQYSGTSVTRAMLEKIRVKINGKPIQEYSDGDELQSINDYYGRADNTGAVTLYFNRPEMDNVQGQRVTGLGTSDIQTLSVEFDVASGAPADFAVVAYALQSEAQPLGLITKVKKYPASYATSGLMEIDNIVKGGRIMAIHLFKSDVSKVELEVDKQTVYEATKSVGEILQKEAGRAPVTASATHIDFIQEGDIAQALITAGVSDMRLKPTIDTSGALNVVVEYLDGLAGA